MLYSLAEEQEPEVWDAVCLEPLRRSRRGAHPLLEGAAVRRVAVVGAGPSGIFTAGALRARGDLHVDVIDRSPTPFGLVRYGVAPDHLKIKAVARTLGRVLSDQRVSFLGNVEVGRDVSVPELREVYSAVVLASGAALPRSVGVPGADLPGHVPAGHVVDWYNGRPGTVRPQGLPTSAVAVIGGGNVALDAARVLLKAGRGLAHTDVTDVVLDELDREPVREVTIVVRRGAADAKFTPAELLDLGKLEDVDIVVDPADLEPAAGDEARAAAERAVATRIAIFRRWSETPATGAPKVLRFLFRRRPTRLLGDVRVTALELTGPDGVEQLPVGAVISAVGYSAEELHGVPFDESNGRIRNDDGRVLPGLYVAGWAKRGPSGVIGSNKTCAAETAALVLADIPPEPSGPEDEGISPLLLERGCRVVDWQGWTAIDAAEIATGAARGRARTKITDAARLVDIGGSRAPIASLEEG